MISGELFALLAALAYGLAGVAINRGKASARGDNGVFLSVLVTATLTGAMWLIWGEVSVRSVLNPDKRWPLAVFALAGLMSTVFGRQLMFRATEQTGPVMASLLRRLTPVFGLPLAYVMLSQLPDGVTLAGAGLVMAAVVFYLPPGALMGGGAHRIGVVFGIGSALAYALAYTLRSHALVSLPDAALGTCVGALAGVAWFVMLAALRRDPARRFAFLIVDRGPWHVLAALTLSAGQFLQFLALKSASVVSVATLGTLEVFFSAVFLSALTGKLPDNLVRLCLAGGVALIGSALMLV